MGLMPRATKVIDRHIMYCHPYNVAVKNIYGPFLFKYHIAIGMTET